MRIGLIILIVLSSCSFSKRVAFPFSKAVQVKLDGSDSYDLDGYIVNWYWKQVSGAPAKILNPTATITIVEVKQKGKSEFELTVTDNDGATDKDTVIVEKKY